MIKAICNDITSPRVDDNTKLPTGISVGTCYTVHMYNENADNNKRPAMIRITNDLGKRAAYAAERFTLLLDE